MEIDEDVELTEVHLDSMYSTFSMSRSRIQLIWSRFKLFKYGNSKWGWVRKLVGYKDIIVGITNILVIENNNCFILKNNIK